MMVPGMCASSGCSAPNAIRGRVSIRGGNGEPRSWQTTPELRISGHYLIHEQIIRLLCGTPWTSSARTSGEDSQANNEPSQCECETQSVLSGVASDFCRHDPPGARRRVPQPSMHRVALSGHGDEGIRCKY